MSLPQSVILMPPRGYIDLNAGEKGRNLGGARLVFTARLGRSLSLVGVVAFALDAPGALVAFAPTGGVSAAYALALRVALHVATSDPKELHKEGGCSIVPKLKSRPMLHAPGAGKRLPPLP